MDIAEHEAKILVYRGDNWQPTPPPATEASPSDQPTTTTTAPTEQKPDAPAQQSETPSQ